MAEVDNQQKRCSSRFFGAWYLCIGAGFVLLGLRALLLGASVPGVALRWIIAAGFVILGILELRSRRP